MSLDNRRHVGPEMLVAAAEVPLIVHEEVAMPARVDITNGQPPNVQGWNRVADHQGELLPRGDLELERRKINREPGFMGSLLLASLEPVRILPPG